MRLSLLSKSRGIINLASRIRVVARRFGITSGKFDKLLRHYSAVARRLDCIPTFPITAVTLKRNIKLVRKLLLENVELAVHGFVHIDYGKQPLDKQIRDYKKAIEIFNRHDVPYTGFRAPFLRINNDTNEALSRAKFAYNSSQAVHWNVLDKADYTDASWLEYQSLLDFYQSRSAEDYPVLPQPNDDLIEIPVSVPDDEAMLERLGICDEGKMSNIWGTILEKTYQSGELFTLQLHPERILQCEKPLVNVIQRARKLRPHVWIATLREIAEWWQERSAFTLEINSLNNGRYRVRSECTGRVTLLIKNCRSNAPVDEWFGGYQCAMAGDFILESPTRPVIGISRDSSSAAVRFLRNEGFIVEKSDRPDNYGIYLNNLVQFNKAAEKKLSQDIERSNSPLLRYWRWPERARSALSVTGDIDSITLIDFILRILEGRLANWR